jgi:hypothetical protein
MEDQSPGSQEEDEAESLSGSAERGRSLEGASEAAPSKPFNVNVGAGFTDDDPLDRRGRAKRLGAKVKRLLSRGGFASAHGETSSGR